MARTTATERQATRRGTGRAGRRAGGRRLARARRLIGWAALIGLALAAVLAGAWYFLASSDLLLVERVVAPRTTYVTRADIVAATRPAAGENLLTVELDEIEAGLRALPYVREVELHRRFPHTLDVSLTEYEPAVRVRVGSGRPMVVAPDGRVLGPAADEALPLVVLSGSRQPEPGSVLPGDTSDVLGLAERIRTGDGWPPEHPVRAIDVASSGDVTLRLEGGGEVRLGEPTRLDSKFMVATEIIKRYLKDGLRLAYVDVHVPERAVARPVGG